MTKILNKKKEITIIAGPNGSGKSTITTYLQISSEYVNADVIKSLNSLKKYY